MANPVLKGSSDPQLQYWEVDFSLTQGAKLVKEYKGIDIAKMSALCNSLSATHSGKLRYEKNVATLTLETTNPSGNIPGGFNSPVSNITDKWEIAADQEKPELFENKNYLGLFDSANASYTDAYGSPVRFDQQVAQIIRKNSGTEYSWGSFVINLNVTKAYNSNGNPLATSGGAPVYLGAIIGAFSLWQGLKYFVDDYLRGRTNYVHGKYLLRHTTSAPSDYAANVADFNVEKIYTIAQLLSECQDPTLWYLPMPGYLAYKILSYPVPGTMPPNYAWGALKMGSGAVTAARNRVEITTEYLIDACPKHTYGLIS